MEFITGAVLKTLLLLSTQTWNRVEAGNSCKYTANDLKLAGVYAQNFNSAVFFFLMINLFNWNRCGGLGEAPQENVQIGLGSSWSGQNMQNVIWTILFFFFFKLAESHSP